MEDQRLTDIKSKLDVKHLLFDFEIIRLKHALMEAMIKCKSFTELLEYFAELDSPYIPLILDRICSNTLTPTQEAMLVPIMQNIYDNAKKLPYKEKLKFERYLCRLARCISFKGANSFAKEFLDDPSERRHKIALRIYQKTGVAAEIVPKLIKRYRENKQQDYLILIIRNAHIVDNEILIDILPDLSEEYWRTRIIQELITRDASELSVIIRKYPNEFVHAVGRAKETKYISTMLELFEENRDDVTFLSIFTWCLGVIGKSEYLNLITQWLSQVEADNTSQ